MTTSLPPPRRGSKAGGRVVHPAGEPLESDGAASSRLRTPYPLLAPPSAVTGVEWPAIPSPISARVLSLLLQMGQSEWWPRETVEADQLLQLSALLRHTRDTVPFYRERLRNVGLDPERALTWEHWRELPILTRSDLQEHFEQIKSTAVPAGHGRLWLARSSGSTGRPVSVLKTDLTRLLWRAFTLRDHFWHGRDLQGRLAAIRYVASGGGAPPQGSVAPSWDTLLGEVVRTGPAYLLQVQADVREQANWLRRIAPDYLVTYPSNLVALLRHFREEGLERPSLRDVTTLAETLPEEARPLCREVWGVEVRDIYSTVECGYLALQCPEQEETWPKGTVGCTWMASRADGRRPLSKIPAASIRAAPSPVSSAG